MLKSSTRRIAVVAIVSTVILALSATSFAQTPVWSDEFDGTSLDWSKWTYDTGGSGFGNQELQFYTARTENVRVENGNLVITGLRENYQGKQFTSARLKTHGRFAFKYGTIEARIKVPDLANGLWPAFWMLGNNIGQHTWPACGEIDILEMGMRSAIDEGVTNRRVSAAAHWDYQGSYALYNNVFTAPINLNTAFHVFKLNWTPQLLTAFVDTTQIWAMDISDIETNSLEEFHEPFFVLINLAVGGINFVEILDPAQITAPFPAEMLVDYVRVYDNGYTEIFEGGDTAETGNFGIFTETTPVDNSVTYGGDAELYIWNNMTAVTTPPYEGGEAWSFNCAPGAWFGMGVYSHFDRNMSNYTDGHLMAHMKTTSTAPFRVGIKSSAAGEFWLPLINGEEEFGLVRDGAWHEVAIPLNRFSNIDFNTIGQLFMLAGDPPPSTFNISIDNVYWSPSVARPTPENGNFGVFTEDTAHKTAGEFVMGVDGDFFIWENTLNPIATNPYEGTASIALSSATGLTWFGAAFTPNIKYDMTAFRYPESKLRFAMKSNSTVRFSIGMKSGTVSEIGQKWILFENGNDPYGFVRDGQWHVVEIPMSDFSDVVNLAEVSQFFELLGVDGGINNIEIDDIAFINGGDALGSGGGTDLGDMNCDGSINFADIPLFVNAVLDPAAFDAAHPSCDSTQADLDESGAPDGLDVQAFVASLIGA